MVRKTKEEAQETRNAILDAAEVVFQKQGVSRTSLAEIAAAAHSAIPAPSYSFTPAGCDCTGGQSTIGSLSSSFPGYLSGGGSIVYLPGADDGTGETPAVPVPVVPVPATGILLLGALGFAAAVRRARS